MPFLVGSCWGEPVQTSWHFSPFVLLGIIYLIFYEFLGFMLFPSTTS